MTPYWADNNTTLYCGDSREVVADLDLTFDLIVADPPYGETAQPWDKWQDGWPYALLPYGRSLWCFGSFRMFTTHAAEFLHWQLSQDLVWAKPSGTGFIADRFVRSHELITHWYQGSWEQTYHVPPTETVGIVHRGHITQGSEGAVYEGKIAPGGVWVDDGTRLARSVIDSRNMRGIGRHPNEKPVRVLSPLIEYGCKPGGLVLDPFAGSGSTAEAARLLGRRSVLIEQSTRWCDEIALRLSQGILI